MLAGPNMLSNYMAVSALIALIINKLIDDKRAFYLAFFAIYCLLGQSISLLIIEHGWVLVELGGVKTYTTYALLFLVITAFFFINILCFIIKKAIYSKVNNDFFSKLKGNKLIYFLPVLYLILVYLPVFIYGSAYTLTGGNRVTYREALPDFFSYLIQIRALIFPLAGLYIFNEKKRLAYIYILMVVLWNLLIGEKASGIIVSIYSIFLPYFLIEYKKINDLKLFIFLFVSVFFIIISIILNYVFVEKNQVSFILDRFSMQGQLWWYYFNEIISNKMPTHYFLDEFTNEDTGLISLMRYAMPSGLYESYMKFGYILTSGFPSIFVFYFGYYWLLPTFLCSLVFVIPVYFITKSLYCGDIFSFLIATRIFSSLITLVAEGSIASFLDYKLFIYVFILIFLQYFPRLKIKFRK